MLSSYFFFFFSDQRNLQSRLHDCRAIGRKPEIYTSRMESCIIARTTHCLSSSCVHPAISRQRCCSRMKRLELKYTCQRSSVPLKEEVRSGFSYLRFADETHGSTSISAFDISIASRVPVSKRESIIVPAKGLIPREDRCCNWSSEDEVPPH